MCSCDPFRKWYQIMDGHAISHQERFFSSIYEYVDFKKLLMQHLFAKESTHIISIGVRQTRVSPTCNNITKISKVKSRFQFIWRRVGITCQAAIVTMDISRNSVHQLNPKASTCGTNNRTSFLVSSKIKIKSEPDQGSWPIF